VPSVTQEMSEPQEKVAMISALYIPSSQLDFRIAFMASLEGGGDLNLLPGGEKYFEAFREPNDDEIEPRYDVIRLFCGLNQLIAADKYVANPSQVRLPPQVNLPENQSPVIASNKPELPKETVKPAGNPSGSKATATNKAINPQPKSRSWSWLVGVVALLLAMGFAVKRYFSKNHS
jgi:hypothetical protein